VKLPIGIVVGLAETNSGLAGPASSVHARIAQTPVDAGK